MITLDELKRLSGQLGVDVTVLEISKRFCPRDRTFHYRETEIN